MVYIYLYTYTYFLNTKNTSLSCLKNCVPTCYEEKSQINEQVNLLTQDHLHNVSLAGLCDYTGLIHCAMKHMVPKGFPSILICDMVKCGYMCVNILLYLSAYALSLAVSVALCVCAT